MPDDGADAADETPTREGGGPPIVHKQNATSPADKSTVSTHDLICVAYTIVLLVECPPAHVDRAALIIVHLAISYQRSAFSCSRTTLRTVERAADLCYHIR
jgi:hypothetical protein